MFPKVIKLAILVISGGNASQYLEKSPKKVNKPKCSVNLSLTSSLILRAPDSFYNFFLFTLTIFFIFLSKWINNFTKHSLKFSLFFSMSYSWVSFKPFLLLIVYITSRYNKLIYKFDLRRVVFNCI